LACNDGLIRTYDTQTEDFVETPPVSVTSKKQLMTMHLTDEKVRGSFISFFSKLMVFIRQIVCGSATGEVTWISVRDLYPPPQESGV
jgi:hypothetical protein